MTIYYLVKYAMSRGIEACKGKPLDTNRQTIILADRYGYYRLGRDVFTNRDDALHAARALRAKRIASLRRQLTNAEATDFV